MTIKIICMGLPTPNSALITIQRTGKRFILATAITVETSLEKLGDFDPNAAVKYSIEEVPEKLAAKLLAETDPDEDAGAVLAFENGVELKGEELEAVRDYVRRGMRSTSVVEFKRQVA